MLCLIFWACSLLSNAEAAPVAAPVVDGTVEIRATISNDLLSIHGTLDLPENDQVRWVDLMQRLPMPTDDRNAQRTWVHRPERGWIRLEPETTRDRDRNFRSILPRRFGATGTVPGRGLFSNGLWHPHPTMNGRAAVVQWDVELTLPDNTIGVLNGIVGENVIRWSGSADRLSLAVIPNARVQHLTLGPDRTLTLVDRGPRRNRRDRHLVDIAVEGHPIPGARAVVVVETPSRRRLTRTGPGVVFLSDRALRLTGPAWRFHTGTLTRALDEASLPISDPWARGLTAGILGEMSNDNLSARQTLKWLSWLPPVDSLLYSGTVPFVSDVFNEMWPQRHVADDPLEVTDNPTPPHAAARKLSALHGPESLTSLATALIAGADLDEAANLAGLPNDALATWRKMPPEQDIRVEVNPSDDGWAIDLIRETTDDAPVEPIPVRIEGTMRDWVAGPGSDHHRIELPTKPHAVAIDPQLQVRQRSRSNDAWPNRWTLTAAAEVPEVALQTGRPTAAAFLVARKRYSSRWVYGLSGSTNPSDMAAVATSISYGFGQHTDRRSHEWRAYVRPGGAVLDPTYRAGSAEGLVAELGVGVRQDTRTAWPIATRGHRVGAHVGTGVVHATGHQWKSASVSALGLISPIPHVTLAHRAHAASTDADVAHRQLSLGGSGAVQGLPVGEILGHHRLIGSSELRWLPIRYASVPAWLAWGTHLQLSAGLDAGLLVAEEELIRALGWSGGMAIVGDLLGGRPSLVGLWVAETMPSEGTEVMASENLQLYLRGTQAF